MYDTTKITCTRCKGKGNTGHIVVYCGAPGTCYKCAGVGEVYKDKFYRRFGVGKQFFGVTLVAAFPQQDNPNAGTFKSIQAGWKAGDVANDRYRVYTATPITEEQARKFYDRYGDQQVRVAA